MDVESDYDAYTAMCGMQSFVVVVIVVVVLNKPDHVRLRGR